MASSTLVFLLQLLLLSLASASHYYGGTVTFTAKGRNADGTFRVEFRDKGTFDGCVYHHSWYCYSGSCGNSVRVQRGSIDSSTNAPRTNRQWCESQTITTRHVPSDKPFQMREASCCWIPTSNYIGSWRLLTLVDLGIRSDTGEPNRSPEVAILPFLRVPVNCPRSYNMMSFDPDGDQVRCRYGTAIGTECNRCRPPAGFQLDQGSCTLYYSNSYTGVYGFELVVEDFPRRPITLAYTDGSRSSRSPLTVRRGRRSPYGTTVSYPWWWAHTATPAPTTANNNWGWWQGQHTSTQPPRTTNPPRWWWHQTNTPPPTTANPSWWWWWQRTSTTPPTTTSVPWWQRTSTPPPTTTSVPWWQRTSAPPSTTANPSWWWWWQRTSTPPPTTTSVPWWQRTSTPPPTTSVPWWQRTSAPPSTTANPSWWWWWQRTSTLPPTTTSVPWWQRTSTPPPTTSVPWWQRTSAPPSTTANPSWWWWWQRTSTLPPTTTSVPWWQQTSTPPPATTSPPWWWWHQTSTPHPTTTSPPTTTTNPYWWRASTTPATTVSWWWWWNHSRTSTPPPVGSTTPGWWTQPNTSPSPWWWNQRTTTPWWWRTTTAPPTTTTTATTTTSAPWWRTRTTTTPRPTTTTRQTPSTTGLYASTSPLSKLPLQFTVLVDAAAPSCNEGEYLPKFLPPTPTNGRRLQAEVNKEMEIRVKAEAQRARLQGVIISGPLNITKHRNTHDEFVIRWTPTEDDLGDHFPICFAAEAVYGSGIYQSEMRCVVVKVVRENVEANVICSESTMRVEVDKSTFPRLHEDNLRLNDPSNTVCSLQSHSNSTHVIAIFPLNACGTQIEEDDDYLMFKNEITTVENVRDLITRKHLLEVQFYCQYPKRGNVTLGFTAHRSNVTVWEKGFGTFIYGFEFYQSSRFQAMMDPNSYPLEFDVGDQIYMEIEATSSVNNTELFVESCRAAPYDNPNYWPTYPIIENGCKVDQTVQIYARRHQGEFRFSMEAFKFIGLHDQVYISCSVIMCEAGNPNTRCSQGCINTTSSPSHGGHHRGKRAAVIQTANHLVSQGPLRLRRSSESTATNLNLNLVFIAGCLLAAVGMICAAAVYKAKTSTVKYQPLPAFET
ncbi:uncharacterized protein [Centroberyx affinis]|uniref:uncharacterized protein n=1 Tax=Centroberyx affinis TaxID=166261 RepID=UPI003A5C661C